MTSKALSNNPWILALDTSQSTLQLAVTNGAKVVAQLIDSSGLSHSQRLFPLLNETFVRLRLTPDQVDAFAVNTVPGSFTGLRVGIAALKGLAVTLDKPLFGVNALDAMALTLGVQGLPLIVALNTLRREIIWGMREISEGVSIRTTGKDQVESSELFLLHLRQRVGIRKAVFIGTGAAANWPSIERLCSDWELKESPDSLASSIARFAGVQFSLGDVLPPNPFYTRPSEAEVMLTK